MQLLLVVAIFIAILAVIFALQNAVPITVSFLTWKFESSLALVLLITVSLGIMMSLLVSVPSMIKRMKLVSSLKRKIQALEKGHYYENRREKEIEINSEQSEPPLE